MLELRDVDTLAEAETLALREEGTRVEVDMPTVMDRDARVAE